MVGEVIVNRGVGGRGSNCQESDSLLVPGEVTVKGRTVC